MARAPTPPPPPATPDAARGDGFGRRLRRRRLFDAQRAMTVPQAARVFVSSVARIMTRDRDAALERDPSGAERGGTDAFDKDDALAVDFVAAVATLRSANYHIEAQSPFDVKGVAGNIVHAVATTNAIVGGLITLEALKILRKSKRKETNTQNDDCGINTRYTFVKKRATNNRLLEPVTPDPPNVACAVCGRARLELVCDTESFTLQRLLLDALTKLGMHAPEINAPETVLYEQPDGLEEDEKAQYEKNLRAVLTALPAGGVRHGAVPSISDFSQKFEFELLVTHRPKSEWDEEEDPDLFILRVTRAPSAGRAGATARRARRARRRAATSARRATTTTTSRLSTTGLPRWRLSRRRSRERNASGASEARAKKAREAQRRPGGEVPSHSSETKRSERNERKERRDFYYGNNACFVRASGRASPRVFVPHDHERVPAAIPGDAQGVVDVQVVEPALPHGRHRHGRLERPPQRHRAASKAIRRAFPIARRRPPPPRWCCPPRRRSR